MPIPKGSKAKRCRLQRALFAKNPEYARKWVEEFGDQCKGVPMKKKKPRRKRRVKNA